MNTLGLLATLPRYFLARRGLAPAPLPVNLTVSLTYRCNSHCRTCRVYDRKPVPEMKPTEYEKLFKSLKNRIYWVTISGGEPFIRRDIEDILNTLCKYTHPAVVNIPTNGFFSEKAAKVMLAVATRYRKIRFTVNVSLDHAGIMHDNIRGLRDSFSHAVETIGLFRELDLPNLTIGVHTVLSRFNAPEFPDFMAELMNLAPDSYVMEMAELRRELKNVDTIISPGIDDYEKAVNVLIKAMNFRAYKGMSRWTAAFRREYYRLSIKTVRFSRKPVACYAGLASAQVTPDANVWECCVKGTSMGDLREYDFDFPKLWKNPRAVEVRKQVRSRGCACPLASAFYTDMLLDPLVAARVLFNYITLPRKDRTEDKK